MVHMQSLSKEFYESSWKSSINKTSKFSLKIIIRLVTKVHIQLSVCQQFSKQGSYKRNLISLSSIICEDTRKNFIAFSFYGAGKKSGPHLSLVRTALRTQTFRTDTFVHTNLSNNTYSQWLLNSRLRLFPQVMARPSQRQVICLLFITPVLWRMERSLTLPKIETNHSSLELVRVWLIAGWDQGFAKLSLGEKARLTIPGALAYGDRGFPGLIPPNATLIFDVELLQIN